MRIGELAKAMLRSFFVITTGIVVSMYLFCLLLAPQSEFSVGEIGKILLMALMSDLLFLLFWSPKELGKMQMARRTAIHAPVLMAVLLYLAQRWDWVELDRANEVALFLLLVAGVYVAVLLANALREKKLAMQLTARIQERYADKMVEEEERI